MGCKIELLQKIVNIMACRLLVNQILYCFFMFLSSFKFLFRFLKFLRTKISASM